MYTILIIALFIIVWSVWEKNHLTPQAKSWNMTDRQRRRYERKQFNAKYRDIRKEAIAYQKSHNGELPTWFKIRFGENKDPRTLRA